MVQSISDEIRLSDKNSETHHEHTTQKLCGVVNTSLSFLLCHCLISYIDLGGLQLYFLLKVYIKTCNDVDLL